MQTVVSEARIEIVAIVSSDPQVRLGSQSFMSTSIAKSVQLYRTGSELLRMLALDPRFAEAVVVVDSRIDDLAPLNLVDAIRSSGLGIDVVVALDSDSPELVQRAMLAGARAAVRRECSDDDLELAVRRVVAARPAQPGVAPQRAPVLSERGAVVAVVGARGGAGRSTLSSLLASMSARAGIDTGLVDFDLQFGDLSLLFGASSDSSLYLAAEEMARGEVPEGFGRSILENLTLYTPDPAPEKSELLTGKVHAAIGALAERHRLLVVSTGAFWTLLHAELLESSDQVVCVLDQTVPGVKATSLLSELLDRAGMASARRLFVVNKARPSGVNPKEIARALGIDRVWVVPDGGPEVALAMDAGGVDLVSDMRSGVVPAVATVLDEIASRTALPMRNVETVRKQMKRPGLWRKSECRR